MTIQKLEKDYSPFTANRIKSPFAKKTKTRTGEFCNVLMIRTFEEYPVKIKGVKVIVRGQFWQCPETLEKVQDEEQLECSLEAAHLAANSEKEVLFFHTKAWKA